MPPLVYSRVAIRIGFCRLQPTGAREGKDHGDTDAHSARYQETRPAGDVPRADSTVVHVDRGRSRSTRIYARSKPGMALGPRVRRHVLAALH